MIVVNKNTTRRDERISADLQFTADIKFTGPAEENAVTDYDGRTRFIVGVVVEKDVGLQNTIAAKGNLMRPCYLIGREIGSALNVTTAQTEDPFPDEFTGTQAQFEPAPEALHGRGGGDGFAHSQGRSKSCARHALLNQETR